NVENEDKTSSAKFYPDIEFNKKERSKTVLLAVLLIFLMGGMSVMMFVNSEAGFNWITGALMLVFVVLGVSMIPGAFKQYPVKNEPLIEVRPREAVITGKTVKISDIYEVRITYTVAPVGKKDENEKHLDEVAKTEPPRKVTANVDVVLKNVPEKSKDKVIYTTVADAYGALLAFYKAGCKHYRIIYSMKKLTRVSSYNLGDTVTEDGLKLSAVSKKDRRKQLF
ncbi:MAG: hypothetical protein J5903_02620, partial [Clostridia bacterium]|nr:hypothetical protein [Clostridia bacterium]